MNENIFTHVNNEADRQALIALREKESILREEIEYKTDCSRRDLKNDGPTSQDLEKLATLMSAIDEIAKKYDHLLPEFKDPYADLLG